MGYSSWLGGGGGGSKLLLLSAEPPLAAAALQWLGPMLPTKPRSIRGCDGSCGRAARPPPSGRKCSGAAAAGGALSGSAKRTAFLRAAGGCVARCCCCSGCSGCSAGGSCCLLAAGGACGASAGSSAGGCASGAPRRWSSPLGSSARSASCGPQCSAVGGACRARWPSTRPLAVQQMETALPAAAASREVSLLKARQLTAGSPLTGCCGGGGSSACCANSASPERCQSWVLPSEQPTASSGPAAASAVATRPPLLPLLAGQPGLPPPLTSSSACSRRKGVLHRHTALLPDTAVATRPSGRKQAAAVAAVAGAVASGSLPLGAGTADSCAPSARLHSARPPRTSTDSA